MPPVCLVIGAGAGIGATVAKRFAREGYHAVLCRRTDGQGPSRAVADTYYHLAHRHRSAWTHEIDLRAFSDLPWWNR